MTADDLSAPLGQQQKRRRRTIRIPVPEIIAGALALFLGLFVLWAVIGDDPFGGEPMVVVPAGLHPATATKTSDTQGLHEAAGGPAGPGRYDGPAATPPRPQAGEGSEGGAPPGTRTVTIIDGKTGARQEVVIPAPGTAPHRRTAPPSTKNSSR